MASRRPHHLGPTSQSQRVARIQSRYAPVAHASLRLHHRNDALYARADDPNPSRPYWLDGQRLCNRLPKRPTSTDLRLLQATLRSSHQPVDRFDPRRRDHVARVLHRSRKEPIGSYPRTLPSLAHPPPNLDQRGTRSPEAYGSSRLENRFDRYHLRSLTWKSRPRKNTRSNLRRSGKSHR